MAFNNSTFSQTVNVPAGATGVSDTISLGFGGLTIASIVIPTAWVTAAITFQASVDGSTWVDIYNSDYTEYTIPAVTGSKAVALLFNPIDFSGFQYVRLRSGTSASPVNQTGSPALTVITRAI